MKRKNTATEKKQGPWMGNILRMAAALYLVYMAYKMFVSIRAGEIGGVPAPLAVAAAAVFAVGGVVVFCLSLKAEIAERKKKSQE